MTYIKHFCSNLMFSIKTVSKVSPGYFYIRILFLIINLLFNYTSLFLWRDIINNLTKQTTDYSDTLMKTVLLCTIWYVSIILAKKILNTVQRLFNYKFNDSLGFYIDSVMIDKTADCDVSFFDSPNLKRTMRLSSIYISNLQRMSEIMFDVISTIANLITAVTLLSSLSWIIVLLVIVTSIPSLVLDHKNRKLDMSFQDNNLIHDQKMEYYCDLFFNENTRHEIRINSSDEYILQLYKKEWEIWDQSKDKHTKKKLESSIISKLILFIGEISTYIHSVLKLTQGLIAVGDISYYISLLVQFRSAFMGIFEMLVRYDDISDKIDDVREFLEMSPIIEKSGTIKPSENPEIIFDNVSFCYPNSGDYVLKNCSFKINQGDTFGLVGLNGSGKSTIVKLLCRFYDPTDGEILIDGINSKEYDIASLRKLFGVLFQDYVHYSFSLRENIAMSDITNKDNTDRIMDACRRSKVTDFIQDWEKGLDSNMTRKFDSNGKELSGGQWQRVSLARAFFRDAPTALLDEPSAALDPVAEHEIFEDFANISKGKSAILISHRLSSITLCDKILVLEDGRIIEQGSHKELLNVNGRYAYLFNLQASKYI